MITPKQICATVLSSNCVLWGGKEIKSLGICPGDSVTEVEALLAQKVQDLLEDTDLSKIELCEELALAVGKKDKNTATLIQVLADNQCSLKAVVQKIQEAVNGKDSDFVVDLKCIKADDACGIVSKVPKVKDVIQIIIDAICDIKSSITNLHTNILASIDDVIGNYLFERIVSSDPTAIKRIGSGENTKVQLFGLVPPNTPIWSYLSLDFFDDSGKGKNNTLAEGWYISNGDNNTIDMRGVTPIGAMVVKGGKQLAKHVDPTVAGNEMANWKVGDRVGQFSVRLDKNNLPKYDLSVTDLGHMHPTPKFNAGRINWGNQNSDRVLTESTPKSNGLFEVAVDASKTSAKTGITVSSGGSDIPHSNIQPSIAGIWIQRIL